jgi:arylsulfatase A-like enzyme
MTITIKMPSAFLITACLVAGFLKSAAADEITLSEIQAKHSVILIIVDTLRPDHLGCYGYAKHISPAVDGIAKDACVFENAFSQSSSTLSSTMSIFTSLYPSSHGMFCIFKDQLPLSVKTMAQVFSGQGYNTAWFSVLKNPSLDIDAGFGRGFQEKRELTPEFTGSKELFAWIEKNKDRNFFLAVDSRGVHDFAKASPGYKTVLEKTLYLRLLQTKEDFFTPADIFDHKQLFTGGYSRGKLRQLLKLLSPDKHKEVKRLRDSLFLPQVMAEIAGKAAGSWMATYDQRIFSTDQRLIKPLCERLKKSGLYDKIVLILTADHGEEFGEHSGYGHGYSLYDEVLRVPLIIKMPNVSSGGRRIKELAQNIDIMPTVLELSGIKAPPEVQGKSLTGVMSGTGAATPHEYIISEGPREKMIRSVEWKLISGDSGKKLFYIPGDPVEQHEVSGENKMIVSKMAAELEQWEAVLPHYKEKEYPFSPGIDSGMQERIRKNGYW